MFILVDESNFFKSIYRPRMFKAIVNKMPKYKDIKNTVTLIVEEEIRTINVISKDSDDNSEGMAILTSDCLEGEQGISFDWIKPFSSFVYVNCGPFLIIFWKLSRESDEKETDSLRMVRFFIRDILKDRGVPSLSASR